MNSGVEIQSRIERKTLSTMKGDAKIMENGKTVESLLDIQPWISTFKTMCTTDQFDESSLNNLMVYFIRNVRTNVNECQKKPLRADKLKGFISETLLFFMYYHRAQEENYDEAKYMNLMSDLLAIYIDTELKASKRSNECHERISGRIASYLYVYLGNSPEYLLDTLFKVRFMSSNYYQILHPIITKIFELIPDQPNSSLMYVRYFLIYRIWKRITKDQKAKNEINLKAMASLRSPPTSFPQHIMDYVLPKVPNTHKITSRYLLQQPMELEKSCESFVKFCGQSGGLRNAVEMEQNRSNATVESYELEDKLPHKIHSSINENSIKQNSLSIIDSNKQSNVQLNSEENLNAKLSRKSMTNTLKSSVKSSSSISDTVMLIDLTCDDLPDRVIKQKINQKGRLSWTKFLFKRKSIVAAPINNNKICENITEDLQHTEDLQRTEDTTRSQSLAVTTNDIDWMAELDLTPSEIAELNSPTANESVMKIDESTTFNQLCDESPTDVTSIRVSETSELSPLKIIDGVNSIVKSNEIAFGNIETKPIILATQIPVDIIEEAEVEVITTDLNIDDVPNECSHNNENEIDNEYFDGVTLPNNLNNGNNMNVNTKLIASNINTELTGYPRDTVLHINKCLQSTDVKLNEMDSSKIHDVELHEDIDGLSLLASVSQRVSHLTSISEIQTKPKDVIKVKDYSSLINIENNERNRVLYENPLIDISNNVVNVFPDDDIDKVAMHVEVTSSEDIYDSSCKSTIYKQELINNYCSTNNNDQSNESPTTSMQVESSIQSDKDDTNVILNGETIVLLQKSPNSNLYIINKAAVENREHVNDGDEEKDLIEKNQTIDKVNNEMYSYEIYDSMYRIGQTTPSTTPYELTQSSDDNVNIATAIDLKKGSKKKSSSKVISPRRRRVRQEFNGCTNTTCQDLVETHSIHIPSSTSLYHSNYATGDLFISCRQNCNSVSCGMPVDHPSAPIHSHKKSSRCPCLNCTYDIVTHCGQCILPADETETKSNIDSAYYIPIKQSSSVQDCSLNKVCNDNKIVGMYDEKLLCKIEASDNEKSTKIYQAEINSKLPLKKRFKSMMSVNFTETSIKKEKIVNNYPSTPMISIAALESRENTESPSKLITHQINSKEINRNNYNNAVLNSYHKYENINNGVSVNAKRKCTEMDYFPLENIDGQLARPLKKVKEQKSPVKKATRRTRSSQRQVPRINYRDPDCEWNPSGETKRKRQKKTTV